MHAVSEGSVAASTIVVGPRLCQVVLIITKGKLVSQLIVNVNVLYYPKRIIVQKALLER